MCPCVALGVLDMPLREGVWRQGLRCSRDTSCFIADIAIASATPGSVSGKFMQPNCSLVGGPSLHTLALVIESKQGSLAGWPAGGLSAEARRDCWPAAGGLPARFQMIPLVQPRPLGARADSGLRRL